MSACGCSCFDILLAALNADAELAVQHGCSLAPVCICVHVLLSSLLLFLSPAGPQGLEARADLYANQRIWPDRPQGAAARLRLGVRSIWWLQVRCSCISFSGCHGYASVNVRHCKIQECFHPPHRYLNGFPDRPPVRPNISLGDSLAGLHAAFGAVMALLHRARSGGGAHGQVGRWVGSVVPAQCSTHWDVGPFVDCSCGMGCFTVFAMHAIDSACEQRQVL